MLDHKDLTKWSHTVYYNDRVVNWNLDSFRVWIWLEALMLPSLTRWRGERGPRAAPMSSPLSSLPFQTKESSSLLRKSLYSSDSVQGKTETFWKKTWLETDKINCLNFVSTFKKNLCICLCAGSLFVWKFQLLMNLWIVNLLNVWK